MATGVIGHTNVPLTGPFPEFIWVVGEHYLKKSLAFFLAATIVGCGQKNSQPYYCNYLVWVKHEGMVANLVLANIILTPWKVLHYFQITSCLYQSVLNWQFLYFDFLDDWAVQGVMKETNG